MLFRSNGALRFRPPKTENTGDSGTNAPASARARDGADDRSRGDRPRRDGHRRGGQEEGAPPSAHTIYILKADAKGGAPALHPVQIKTGITDGIATEVLEGLNEGDLVVTGAILNNAQAAATTANPFGGGGFSRGR